MSVSAGKSSDAQSVADCSCLLRAVRISPHTGHCQQGRNDLGCWGPGFGCLGLQDTCPSSATWECFLLARYGA